MSLTIGELKEKIERAIEMGAPLSTPVGSFDPDENYVLTNSGEWAVTLIDAATFPDWLDDDGVRVYSSIARAERLSAVKNTAPIHERLFVISGEQLDEGPDDWIVELVE